MHTKNILFLLTTLLSVNIFCMNIPSFICAPTEPIKTDVIQPYLVAWLDDHVFIGGENGYEILDTQTHTLKNSEIFSHYPSRILYDVAVNKEKTQYAISLFGMIKCRDIKKHTDLWHHAHSQPTYIPITFDSQDENRVIFCCNGYMDTYLTPIPDKNHVLYFQQEGLNPISCHPNKTQIFSHSGNYYTLRWRNESSRVFSLNRTLEARYMPNGNLILNMGNQLRIMEYIWEAKHIIELGPDHSCCAFECYNDSIVALLTQQNILIFCNYVTKQLLAQVSLQHLTQEHIKHHIFKRLSFSPDKRKLIVALQDNCFVIPVPDPVLLLHFSPILSQKMFSAFCLLKPYH